MRSAPFFKRLSPNDLGITGGHQSGILIPKECAETYFPRLLPNTGIARTKVTLNFQSDPTPYVCNFIYYSSKDEYRITLIPHSHFRECRSGDLLIFTPTSKNSFNVALAKKKDNSLRKFSRLISEDKGAWGQLKAEDLREAIEDEFNKRLPDVSDALPQVIGEQLTSKWEGRVTKDEIEQIIADLDNRLRNASPEVKTRAVQRIERNYSLARVVKEQRGYSCQLCGYKIKKATGGFYIETHHLEALGDGGLDFSKNIIVVCPNCHKTLHFGNTEKLHHDEKRVVIRLDEKVYSIPLEATDGKWLAEIR